MHLAFGPVPSRRLGNSLGINNIPPKHCTYSCVYCQVGRTTRLLTNRKIFYSPSEIMEAAQTRLHEIPDSDSIDYITLVPDGEPTLDIQLGDTIQLLQSLGHRIAILTNGSLLWRKDIRFDLQDVDWISVKIDTVRAETWHRINRPNRILQFNEVLQGIREFRRDFNGIFTTETMLVRGENDTVTELESTGEMLAGLKPDIAYLAVPTRPPAESWVQIPDAEMLNRGYQSFLERLNRVELLTGRGSEPFVSSGDITRDLLSITSVHPLTESAVKTLLRNSNGEWADVQQLLDAGKLRKVQYHNQEFYLRNFEREYSE